MTQLQVNLWSMNGRLEINQELYYLIVIALSKKRIENLLQQKLISECTWKELTSDKVLTRISPGVNHKKGVTRTSHHLDRLNLIMIAAIIIHINKCEKVVYSTICISDAKEEEAITFKNPKNARGK